MSSKKILPSGRKLLKRERETLRKKKAWECPQGANLPEVTAQSSEASEPAIRWLDWRPM